MSTVEFKCDICQQEYDQSLGHACYVGTLKDRSVRLTKLERKVKKQKKYINKLKEFKFMYEELCK